MLSDSKCLDGLRKAGIDIEKLNQVFGGLKARPASDPNIAGYKIFNGDKSTAQEIVDLKEARGKEVAAGIYGQSVMLLAPLCNSRGSAEIAAIPTRAIALIHEAVHLTFSGKYRDADFDGSTRLSDIIVKSCYSALYGYKNLSIVGN